MNSAKFFIALLFVTPLIADAQLSPVEKKVVAYIDEHLPETIELLKKTTDINSGTLHVEGVKNVGEIFGKELEKAGFKTTWVSLPDSLRRAGHLVATRTGNKGKKVFIIGHLDTVFEPDMPANPFRMLNDSTATGQGVNDMKGGDVIAILALQALNQFGLLEGSDITVYFTGDEERAGHPVEVSRADFIERAKRCDIALGFEGASGTNIVATARRGASSWLLEVSGKQAHSSGVFSERGGYGAIYEAARIINEFRTSLSSEKYLTFNPGMIAGGAEVNYFENKASADVIGKDNIITPAAIVHGDLRFLTAAQKENARTKMKSIVANHLPGTNAKITFYDGIPSMAPTEGNNRLLSLINQVSIDLGMGETKAGDPGARGAGDISYVAEFLDCIVGLGSIGEGAHAPGETIHLKTIPFLSKRAAMIINRLVQQR
ncbi:MAG: M20/M25/M40 family metallo-hydrolase [Chitinophagaceae bacterium]|nr:M20/M25/M40 family metallo-hydrolase [Chitinophagaceae bacterium]